MNYKKTLLFSLLFSFFCVNTAYLPIKAEGEAPVATGLLSSFSMPEWIKFEGDSVDFGQLRDKAAMYLGYLTALFLLEQMIEKGIHYYNKTYADHAKAFKNEIMHSGLGTGSALSCQKEGELKALAAEFRNPLYRYTIGLIKKNKIEEWLESQILSKQLNNAYKIDLNGLTQLLFQGSY